MVVMALGVSPAGGSTLLVYQNDSPLMQVQIKAVFKQAMGLYLSTVQIGAVQVQAHLARLPVAEVGAALAFSFCTLLKFLHIAQKLLIAVVCGQTKLWPVLTPNLVLAHSFFSLQGSA